MRTIDKLFWSIYISDIEVLLIVLLVLLILWAMLACKLRKKMKILSVFVAIISVVAIVYTTLVSRSEPALAHEVMPFASFIKAIEQPEMFRSMFMNIVLFMPLGITLPFVFNKSSKRVLISVLIGSALSLVVEFLQYAFLLGFAETDDVLCNTVGVFMGCGTWCLAHWFCRLKNNFMKRKYDE